MRLESFSYWEEKGPGDKWEIDGLAFSQFNLVVGRNATGKTRLLKAIARAAAEKSGETTAVAGATRMRIVLAPDVRDDPEFPQAKNSTGEELARLRQEVTSEWGRRLQYLPFSGRMDLKTVAAGGTFARLDLAEAYRRGWETFGMAFQEGVVRCMGEIGYPIQDIVVTEWKGKPVLGVKESKRPVITPLPRLSQGEQRTLTMLVFLAAIEMEEKATTVLIDDFAEGMDFERAKRAGEFLLRKVPESPLQFIVATNDRYVMNAVPLEYWTVLAEEGAKTRVFNYENSKEKFDAFKFTGLNNFDFFSMDYASPEA